MLDDNDGDDDDDDENDDSPSCAILNPFCDKNSMQLFSSLLKLEAARPSTKHLQDSSIFATKIHLVTSSLVSKKTELVSSTVSYDTEGKEG